MLYDGEFLKKQKNGKGKEYDAYGRLIFEGEYLKNIRKKGKYYEYLKNDKTKLEYFYLNEKDMKRVKEYFLICLNKSIIIIDN